MASEETSAPIHTRPVAGSGDRLDTVLGALLVFVPGVLTVYLSFESGGFFPGATALTVLLLLLLLLLRLVLLRDPFAGFSLPLALAVGALMALAVLTLASSAWSDAPARALTEFDRTLLYLTALVLFGSLPRTPQRVRWMVWGLAAAMAGVCVLAFITRTMPDVLSAPSTLQRNRLSYPIGYWNALGLMASLALVFCLHLTCSAREPLPVRVAAAAVMPVVGATLLFTFSRGPLAVGIIGVVAYLVLGRPRLGLTGLVAAAPPTAVAVIVAYGADFSAEFVKGRGYANLSATGLAEAHDVALTVALCVAGAAGLRALLALAYDPALARLELSRRTTRRLALGSGVAAAVVVVAGLGAALSSGWLERQYDRVVSDPVAQTGDYRDRLFNPGLNRVDHWTVALDAFERAPVKGEGAGTYRLAWEEHRPTDSDTIDAHSLYLEMLGELGLPGLLLLVVALLAGLGAMAARLRGRDRSVYAALLAGALVWGVGAALDWFWELPAVTLWIFAAAGTALAQPAQKAPPRRVGVPVRLAVAAALALLAVTPVRLALSDERLSNTLEQSRAGRCTQAIESARSSIAALGSRPEPYQLRGYCQVRIGAASQGVTSLQEAVRLDPGNWRYHYGLALTQAIGGADPRPEARTALRLNPNEKEAREAVLRLRSANPQRRRRAAARILGLGLEGR